MSAEPPIRSELSEKDLFLQALEIENQEERNQFLSSQCSGDDSAIIRIQKLIRAHDQDDVLLNEEVNHVLDEERTSLSENIDSESQFAENLGQSITQLEGYELLEEIGRGSMGVVYRARQINLNREVALKIILGASFITSTERERFRFEAEATAGLQDRHIVPVYEIGTDEGHDFYSMAYVQGGTLSDYFLELKSDQRRAVTIIATLARTMQVAHNRGILHRDLKPDNILIDQSGEPMISDFGLAYHLDTQRSLTLTGQILGTPQYMSPEQADGLTKDITTQTDIYSLGAILYELLSGKPIFKADSILNTLKLIQESAPLPLSTHCPKIDRDLETIIHKCLEKKPSDRYHSADGLAEDLEAWLDHKPIAARPPSLSERLRKTVRRRPIHAALGFTILLFILTLGIGGPMAAFIQNDLRKSAESESQRANETAEESQQQLYYSNMNLAGLASTESGMFPTLSPLLNRWVPGQDQADRRGWEWYYLASLLKQASATVPGNGTKVQSIDISPSGEKMVVSFYNPQSLEIRDTQTGALLRKIPVLESTTDAQWHPDGNSILTIAKQEQFTLYDSETGKQLRRSKPIKNANGCFAFSGGGRQIISAGRNRSYRVWNVENLRLVNTIPIIPPDLELNKKPAPFVDIITKVRWSSRGNYHLFLPYPQDGSTRIFVKKSGDKESPLVTLGDHTLAIRDAVFSPDESKIATACSDKLVRIFDTKSGQLLQSLKGHTSQVMALAWSPDGRKIVSGSINRELKIWDIDSGKVHKNLIGHTSRVTNVNWSKDGKKIVSGDLQGNLKIWDPERPLNSRKLFQSSEQVSSLDWSPDGTQIVCSTEDSKVFTLDASTGQTIRNFDIVNRLNLSFAPVSWSPDGSQISARTGTVRFDFLNPSNGELLNSYRVETENRRGIVVSTAWTSDGKQFATCSYGKEVHLIDATTGELIVELAKEGSDGSFLLTLSLSPDDRFLAVSGKRGRITIWDLTTRKIIANQENDSETLWFIGHSWHPDSSLLALGNFDNKIRIIDPKTLEVKKTLIGHSSEVFYVSWSPDGKRLASGGKDGTVKIWDVETGEVTLTLRGHEDNISGLAWGPGGRRLISGSEDGSIRMWDASPAFESVKK